MKSVKILIATAILSTSFYACKKEEMNMKSGKVTLQSSNQNNISPEGTFDASSGMIKIVFNKVGTMIIEGNPNLEKLINMYDASKTAIASANEVFAVTQQETLMITFDRNGYTLTSDIPELPIGSSFEQFINTFCKVAPASKVSVLVNKLKVERNYEEFWQAMPIGRIENFEKTIKVIQENLPIGYSMQLSFTTAQGPQITYLNENGEQQPIQNSNGNCDTEYASNWWLMVQSVDCFMAVIGWGI